MGRVRNYPAKKPILTWGEVWQRYLNKQNPIPELQSVQQEGGEKAGIILHTIAQIYDLVNRNGIQFILVMTQLLREIGEPGSRDYEIKARHRLKKLTEIKQIVDIDFLPILNSQPNAKTFYQDSIHLNFLRNQFVNKVITEQLTTL